MSQLLNINGNFVSICLIIGLKRFWMKFPKPPWPSAGLPSEIRRRLARKNPNLLKIVFQSFSSFEFVTMPYNNAYILLSILS